MLHILDEIVFNEKYNSINKGEKEEKDENIHRVERVYGSFTRILDLPGDVDPDNIDATYKKGILELVLRKTQTSEARKIAIKTG